jgi:hypothetical protein
LVVAVQVGQHLEQAPRQVWSLTLLALERAVVVVVEWLLGLTQPHQFQALNLLRLVVLVHHHHLEVR